MTLPPESRDATEARDRVLAFIRAQGGDGATIDELAVATGLTHERLSLITAVLLSRGLIHGAGLQRLDRINRFRTVFFATEG